MVNKWPWVGRWRLESANNDLQMLRDKVRALEAELKYTREIASKASDDALASRSMVADWLAEHMFGTRVFGAKGPSLPTQLPPIAQTVERVSAPRSGRAVVKEMESKFFEAYDRRMTQQMEDDRLKRAQKVVGMMDALDTLTKTDEATLKANGQ